MNSDSGSTYIGHSLKRCFFLLCAFLLHVQLGAQTAVTSTDELALVGGTVYTSPNSDPIYEGIILVRHGRIVSVGRKGETSIPSGIETLDCTGMTISAGFWNSHAHFFERKWANVASIPATEVESQLRDMLTMYGFTSVFDLGSEWRNTKILRSRIESGEVKGPKILSTGEPLIAAGANPAELVYRIMGFMTFDTPEVMDSVQARSNAENLIAAGVDGIKLHLQPSSLPNPPSLIDAIPKVVSMVHKSGKPVFAHPNSNQDVLAAITGGVDIIAHTTPASGSWDTTIIGAMKGKSVALTPTLTLWKSFLRHDRKSTQEMMVRTAISQLRSWLDAGGAVLFGTDLGAVDYDPTEEYLLMEAAGMSFLQILASLTSTPGQYFGGQNSGTISIGSAADLVVFQGDPSKDIKSLSNVKFTIRDGSVIYAAN